MAQLMAGRAAHKYADRAVGEQRQPQERYRPQPIRGRDVAKGDVSQRAGGEPEHEMAASLLESLPITTLHQLTYELGINLAAVPGNLLAFLECLFGAFHSENLQKLLVVAIFPHALDDPLVCFPRPLRGNNVER